MALKWYIKHYDLQTPDNGIAYFGPFDKKELDERVNDAYADGLASFGELEVVRMRDKTVGRLYINSREYWMKQLADIEEDNK